MNTYRIYGQKMTNYYADVQADDPIEAWNKADGLYSNEWNQMEDDDVIAPTEWDLLEDIAE
jgi:hypothetical protein